MDRDIFGKRPLLRESLKWLAILLCCLVEWGLLYQNVYLYMSPPAWISLSASCAAEGPVAASWPRI